jgi:hypothetical protein
MTILEQLQKIFELKKDPMEFLNSPLFLIIVVVVAIAILIAYDTYIDKKRLSGRTSVPRKRLQFRHEKEELKKPEPVQISEKQPVTEYKIKPYDGIPTTNNKLSENECVIIAEDDESITVLMNKDGFPDVKKLFFSPAGEQKKPENYDLTTERRRPVYVPYCPAEKPIRTIRNEIYSEKPSEERIKYVEQQVDELLAKKKRNFLNTVVIQSPRRDMAKEKENQNQEAKETETVEKEQVVEQTEIAPPPLTEEEVFSDEEPEEEPEAEQPQPSDESIGVPAVAEGDSKRKTIFKLLAQGKTADQIMRETGCNDKTFKKYRTDWINYQQKKIHALILDGKWLKIQRMLELIDSKETFLFQDGKLYYPGRDKLTYVFIATTIMLGILAVYLFLV